MKIIPECVPCAYRICMSAMNLANVSTADKFKAFNQLTTIIPVKDTDMTPCMYHTHALHEVSRSVGVEDLFKEAKEESNRLALTFLDHLVRLVATAEDPLYMAFQISVAGNIVDMGIIPDYDLDAAIQAIPDSRFHIDSYREFRELALKDGRVMIIGDNSGEIAFDMLLVKELQNSGVDVVYGVKGGPVLNDATMEDANQVGMTKLCRVVTNGCNYLGTEWKYVSQEFKDEFNKAGAVIAKGQANFETLEGTETAGDKTFFLLRIKCECVGECAGAPYGSLVFKRNKIQ